MYKKLLFEAHYSGLFLCKQFFLHKKNSFGKKKVTSIVLFYFRIICFQIMTTVSTTVPQYSHYFYVTRGCPLWVKIQKLPEHWRNTLLYCRPLNTLGCVRYSGIWLIFAFLTLDLYYEMRFASYYLLLVFSLIFFLILSL